MRQHGVSTLLAGATVCLAASLAVTAAPAALAVTAAPTSGAVARAGAWGTAIEVPGLASLSKGQLAAMGSVSCATPGNCAAGGFYLLPTDQGQAFLVSETNGRWGKAIKVHGSGGLTAGGRAPADVASVSCA